ncbi:MAG: LamG-like jellyroll fold domain-containing protein, partial [Candidatus Woesearchaeota archaeon]
MPFEDDSSTTWTKDYSTYGNNGTVINATWLPRGGYDGWGAYDFNGINTSIITTNDTSLNLTYQVTLTAWVKLHTFKNWMRIVAKATDYNAPPFTIYGLLLDNAGHARMEIASGGVQNAVNGNTTLPIEQWVFLAATYDNTTMKLYVNGLLDNSTPLTGAIDTNNRPVSIGSSAYTPGPDTIINATIDEVMIYNRALTEEQIMLLYLNKTAIISSQETKNDEIWQVCATPNDKLVDGDTVCSNYVAIKRRYNFTNISITKTDNPDPVNKSQNLTYHINVSSTGNGTAYNVIVNDTYPAQVIYLTSQPTPLSGTNNTWLLGNLTPGMNITINITVLVLNVTNGTIINNTVNISYTNETGTRLNTSTTINTTIINRPPSIAQIILNTTNPLTNYTTENLTVYIINATDPDDTVIQNITDWQLNTTNGFALIAVLNMPFETNTQSTAKGAIRDYGTYGNNGTLAGSNPPLWTPSGKVGGAYLFDGTNRIINVSDSPTLDGTSTLTISVWVYPRVLDGAARGIISKRVSSSSNQSYSLFFYTGNKLFVDIVGTGNRFSTNTTFSTNKWYHIVLVYDGTLPTAQRAKVYINGTLDTVASETSTSIPDYISDITIGALNAGYGTYYNGTIDEVLILNRSLSAEQVSQLYAETNSGKHLMTIVPPETKENDVWQTCVTPNDNQTHGNTICSNYVIMKKLKYNFTNISITKTDKPDPVNASTNLTYQINITSTGNGTAYNVIVNDTYPA